MHEPSDGNKLCPVRMFEVWFEDLPISLLRYRGKMHILGCVVPKQLIPKITCTQQVAFLMVGTVSRLCLLTCPFLLPANKPADNAVGMLAVIWFHSSWVIFGSVSSSPGNGDGMLLARLHGIIALVAQCRFVLPSFLVFQHATDQQEYVGFGAFGFEDQAMTIC